MTDHHTHSVHTGGVAFLLCSMLGATGGFLGLSIPLFGHALQDMILAERLILAASWCAGFSSIGVAIGAILGMICGSTLARSFHMVFLAAAAWIVLVAALTAWENAGGPVDPATGVRIVGYCGMGILIFAAVVGWRMARSTTGFTSRARFWAAIGVGAALLAAPVGYGLWTAKLINLMQWDWSEDDFAITAMIAIALATLAGIAGAIYAADRRVAPGFALLPVQPPGRSPASVD